MSVSRSTTIVMAMASMSIILFGCRSAPPKYYYTFANDTEVMPQTNAGSPLCERPVAVPMVDVAVPYDNDRIVYRTDDYEINHFNYRFWVSRPQDIFQQLLTQALERAHLFASVEPELHSSRDPLLLLARVDAVELLPRKKTMEVRLALSMRLRDSKTDTDLWEHNFDTKRRVEARHPDVKDAVRTLNAIYNAEIKRALDLLAGFLRNQKQN